MSDVLATLALKPTTFVHFVNPATDEPIYLALPEGHPKAGEPDLDKPVGVNVYGPGSKEYRAAQTAITQENIDRKRRKVTADLIQKNAVELLARTTYEFVNFQYEGKTAGLEACRAFYLDPRFTHLKEQVQDKQGAFGDFLPTQSDA